MEETTISIPHDYAERVYAGVLGKIIGVYVGRPVEGWTHERIMARFGEIWYYVHQSLDRPIVEIDDDISGTLTFVRALPDHGNDRHITPQQIGETWFNYIIEGRTILAWGGLGYSSGHTAFLRIKSGIQPPQSGSIAINGRGLAEEIGAQIFIDGWAMVAPGDPELAADLARRAASVSFDGEGIYGAQVIAAMEAQAFVERDTNKLLDVGMSIIPHSSMIYEMINDVREWHARDADWRVTRERIAKRYAPLSPGPHLGSRCVGRIPIVTNQALIMLGLLYGDDDFQKSLMVVNTAGLDTDCNSGNLGCLLGIKNGLAGMGSGPDWRGPVADRLYIQSADGGRGVSDAVSEAYHIVNVGRALDGKGPLTPKGGARFHFELPGAVQGFQPEDSVESKHTVTLENVVGHSQRGERSLALHYRRLASGQVARVATATFIPPEAIPIRGYPAIASPTLYPGQTVEVGLEADGEDRQRVACRLYVRTYGPDDELLRTYGPQVDLEPGEVRKLTWQMPGTSGAPIAEIGLEIQGEHGASGTVYLDYLTWDGAPTVALRRPDHGGTLWRRAWVQGVDRLFSRTNEPYRLVQNSGTGLLMQGTREWRDYRASAAITFHMVSSAGIGIRAQGMRRYYALLLHRDGQARLVKAFHDYTVLAETAFPWEFGQRYELAVQVAGTRLQGWVEGELLFDIEDQGRPLAGGGVALVCEEGSITTDVVTVQPAC